MFCRTFVSLALIDPYHHALAVDIGHFEAVSYTHLDVYKRQGIDLVLRVGLAGVGLGSHLKLLQTGFSQLHADVACPAVCVILSLLPFAGRQDVART